MPDGPGEEQAVRTAKNGGDGTKRGWKLATRNRDRTERAPRTLLRAGPWVVSRRPRCTGWASARRGRLGRRGSTVGGHPRSDPAAAADGGRVERFPSGSRSARSPEGAARDRTRWGTPGRQGPPTSRTASSGRSCAVEVISGEPDPSQSGWTPARPGLAARPPLLDDGSPRSATTAFHDYRLVGSRAVGGEVERTEPRRTGAASGRQVDGQRRSGPRAPTQDPVSSRWTLRDGSAEGATNLKGGRPCAPGQRRPDRARTGTEVDP